MASARLGYLEAIVDVRDVLIFLMKENEKSPAVTDILHKADVLIQEQKKVRMEEYNKETIDDQSLHSNTEQHSV